MIVFHMGTDNDCRQQLNAAANEAAVRGAYDAQDCAPFQH
jgi:hypothetical protein